MGRLRTRQVQSSNLNVFREWATQSSYSELKISEVGPKHIHSLLNWLKLERKLGNRTYNNYLAGMRGLFNGLIHQEIIAKNPCAGIPKLPTDIGRNVAYSLEQREALEKYLKAKDKQLYYFTRFIYYGFLRPQELVKLQIKHMDLPNKFITVPSAASKNGKQQSVTITASLEGH